MNKNSQSALEKLLSDPDVKRIMHLLNTDGEETRLVGGAVRNALLGIPVGDKDCATTALPETVMSKAMEAGLKVVPTGLSHGTVTIISNSTPFEITTLREDVETHGRHAVVRFGRDFKADALRRDFTINALSVDQNGHIHDETNGLTDLDQGKVRFIGNADQRIREDYLRILRFFRFHAYFGKGEPDKQGLEAAIRHKEGMNILSKERIGSEIIKILQAPKALHAISVMAQHELLQPLIGKNLQLERLKKLIDFEESIKPKPSPMRRLAALRLTKLEDIQPLREALRLSNAQVGQLEHYIHLQNEVANGSLLTQARVRALAAQHPDLTGISALTGENGFFLLPETEALLRAFITGEETAPVFTIRAKDFAQYGVEPGLMMGTALKQARKLWLDQGCPGNERSQEAIIEAVLNHINA
jgi:poly(A) polymerase